jgi:serine/threonine protein kinase
MPRVNEHLQQLASQQLNRLDEVLRRFEAAWQAGQTPVLDDFLEGQDTERRALLIELVHTDLEHRLKGGQGVRVEDYLARYPELADERQQVVVLIIVEYELRRRFRPNVAPEEYLRRFPQFHAELCGRFGVNLSANAPEVQGGVIAGGAAAEIGQDLERTGPLVPPPGPAAEPESPRTPVAQVTPRSIPPAPELAEPFLAGRPAPPGYVILDVIARGGMGVVYKARELALNRLVAIKMILSGAHASEEELARFRNEAETVARLQHPNIVQIHAIGVHEGVPFIALELVGGGNLAQKTAGQTMPAGQAAALIETLARAVHHAHQRDVIHRDLKPSNVLLTDDGAPKICDFGLAKQLQAGAGHTRTGTVLGTPSFMAPEQAAGQTQAIGPLSDVYALGAILYALLTGRPPFLGATERETVDQVCSCEPVAPSQLQGNVPRDLETICLNALVKDPSRRYASAQKLADDLARFRAGAAIEGRLPNLVPQPQTTPGRSKSRTFLSSILGKLARKPRTAAVATLLVAVVVLVGVAWSRYKAGRVEELHSQIAERLEVIDGSAEQIKEIEARIDRLERLDPESAAEKRKDLVDRLRRIVIRLINEPRLGDPRVAPVHTAIDLVAARDADAAANLREHLEGRVTELRRGVARRIENTKDAAELVPGTEALIATLEPLDRRAAEEERQQVVQRLLSRFKPSLLDLMARPGRAIKTLEPGLRICRLPGVDPAARLELEERLLRAYLLANREKDALVLVREMLASVRDHPHIDPDRRTVLHYARLLRRQGSAKEAKEALDRWQTSAADPEAEESKLIVERARLYLAMGDREKAKQQFDRALNPKLRLGAALVLEAALCKGILLRDQGDERSAKDAQDAWKRGVAAYRSIPRPRIEWSLPRAEAGVANEFTYLLLLSLTEQLSLNDQRAKEKANHVREHLFHYFGSSAGLGFIAAGFIPKKAYLTMWQTDRGKKIAPQYAFRDLSYGDYFRTPLFLLMAETLHGMILTAPPTANQEELLWNLIKSNTADYTSDEPGLTYEILKNLASIMQSGETLLWKNGTAERLRPSQRGPIAYVLGMRCLRRNKRDEAREFFDDAVRFAKYAHDRKRLHDLVEAERRRVWGP